MRGNGCGKKRSPKRAGGVMEAKGKNGSTRSRGSRGRSGSKGRASRRTSSRRDSTANISSLSLSGGGIGASGGSGGGGGRRPPRDPSKGGGSGEGASSSRKRRKRKGKGKGKESERMRDEDDSKMAEISDEQLAKERSAAPPSETVMESSAVTGASGALGPGAVDSGETNSYDASIYRGTTKPTYEELRSWAVLSQSDRDFLATKSLLEPPEGTTPWDSNQRWLNPYHVSMPDWLPGARANLRDEWRAWLISEVPELALLRQPPKTALDTRGVPRKCPVNLEHVMKLLCHCVSIIRVYAEHLKVLRSSLCDVSGARIVTALVMDTTRWPWKLEWVQHQLCFSGSTVYYCAEQFCVCVCVKYRLGYNKDMPPSKATGLWRAQLRREINECTAQASKFGTERAEAKMVEISNAPTRARHPTGSMNPFELMKSVGVSSLGCDAAESSLIKWILSGVNMDCSTGLRDTKRMLALAVEHVGPNMFEKFSHMIYRLKLAQNPKNRAVLNGMLSYMLRQPSRLRGACELREPESSMRRTGSASSSSHSSDLDMDLSSIMSGDTVERRLIWPADSSIIEELGLRVSDYSPSGAKRPATAMELTDMDDDSPDSGWDDLLGPGTKPKESKRRRKLSSTSALVPPDLGADAIADTASAPAPVSKDPGPVPGLERVDMSGARSVAPVITVPPVSSSNPADAPVIASNPVPPSAVPPSAVPPSAVPPSAVPPSAVPPSAVPPSALVPSRPVPSRPPLGVLAAPPTNPVRRRPVPRGPASAPPSSAVSVGPTNPVQPTNVDVPMSGVSSGGVSSPDLASFLEGGDSQQSEPNGLEGVDLDSDHIDLISDESPSAHSSEESVARSLDAADTEMVPNSTEPMLNSLGVESDLEEGELSGTIAAQISDTSSTSYIEEALDNFEF